MALLAIGCATPTPPRDPRVRPVENLGERLVFQGFSVVPPQGQGWLIIPAGVDDPRRGRTVVSLGKPLRERRPARPEELHTAGARVVVLDVQDTGFDSPEAYLRFVEDEAKRGLTGRRFRQIEARYAIEQEGPAPLCVRHETVVEDSQVPGFPGAVFVLAARGLRCVHPHWPRYVRKAKENYIVGEVLGTVGAGLVGAAKGAGESIKIMTEEDRKFREGTPRDVESAIRDLGKKLDKL